MNRTDVEQIVRSIMRDYGMRSHIARIDLSEGKWEIELVHIDGVTEALTVFDSPPQNLRRSLMTALEVEG